MSVHAGGEVHGTYVASSMSRIEGDDMLKWACNQASFGGSLLKNNMEVEAAMELQRHLDETGVHRVCTIYVYQFIRFAPCSTWVC